MCKQDYSELKSKFFPETVGTDTNVATNTERPSPLMLTSAEANIVQNALKEYHEKLLKKAEVSVTWEDQKDFWQRKAVQVETLLARVNVFNSRNVFSYKKEFPSGTRVILDNMCDPYAPVPPGTKGTVDFVDDAGHIHMKWDNGRTLALVLGVDSFRKLTEEEINNERGNSNV